MKAASVWCLVATLLGCAGAGGVVDPIEDRFPVNQPAVADVAGSYHPTAATSAMIAEGGYPAREIEIALDPSGAARLRNIPDWWRDGFGRPGGGFGNWSGSWAVTPSGHGGWGLTLDLSDPPGSLHTDAQLIGQRPPYRIGLVLGDPDDRRVMEFERLEPVNEPKPRDGTARAK